MNKTALNSQKEKHSIANFYPRSPCGERHLRMSLLFVCKNFYPRSPCGERRTGPVGGHIPDRISIHALLAESDVSSRKLPSSWRRFLSTLSLRRATWLQDVAAPLHRFLSTLSLRRATSSKTHDRHKTVISIHALLAESDYRAPPYNLMIQHISIHALLAESDTIRKRQVIPIIHFYPRSPCGERLHH